jgi:hypothetical protein
MSVTRQRRGASIARLGGVTPTSGTDGGYPWSDGEYLYAADLNAAFSSLFSPGYLPLTGGTLTGPLQLAANPTLGSGAATKSYVDTVAVTGAAATALNNIGRNLLHNPLFNVAQRGAGPWTASAYTADRWKTSIVTDAATFSIVPMGDTDRAAIGDEAVQSALYCSFTGNAATGATTSAFQPIENVRRLSGKTVTVSFWAQGSATLKFGINVFQYFGTGGSPSPTVYALATGSAVTVSGTWARYSATIPIPSISGKTLGTNGDHATTVQFFYSSGATGNATAGNIGVQSGVINLWGVQLEIGSVATPLEKPDPRYDLSNCQRFYQGFLTVGASGYGTPGIVVEQWYSQTVPMRATPTITVNWGTNTNISPTAVANGSGVNISGSLTGTGQWGFNANVIALSADL